MFGIANYTKTCMQNVQTAMNICFMRAFTYPL